MYISEYSFLLFEKRTRHEEEEEKKYLMMPQGVFSSEAHTHTHTLLHNAFYILVLLFYSREEGKENENL